MKKPKHQKSTTKDRFNSLVDESQKLVIPVGPRFQADVPEWNGPPQRKYPHKDLSKSDSSKFLGTVICSKEDIIPETDRDAIGKGRPDRCDCYSPGSILCVKRHIAEKRAHLQKELGPVFRIWKFDEMGEAVAEIWKQSEQQKFARIVKTNPVSEDNMEAPHRSTRIITSADDVLITPSPLRELVKNNYHLDESKFRCEHPVIVEILKNHPLNYALTATAVVPVIYLQQLWHTLAIVHDEETQTEFLQGQLDTSTITITRRRFRKILKLPTPKANSGRKYKLQVSESRLLKEIYALGYSEELPNPSAFTRNHLSSIWFTLFSILNRCLSAITRGIEKSSTTFLQLFHAVAYDRHVDYSRILWNELLRLVEAKKNNTDRKFIPYMRFLQLIIQSELRRNQNIHQRSEYDTCPDNPMCHLTKRAEISGITPMPLPASLLSYANPEAQSVIEYRARLGLAAPMVRPEPAGPSRGVQPPRREGSRMILPRHMRKQVHDTGVPEPAGPSREADAFADVSSADESSHHHSKSVADPPNNSDDDQNEFRFPPKQVTYSLAPEPQVGASGYGSAQPPPPPPTSAATSEVIRRAEGDLVEKPVQVSEGKRVRRLKKKHGPFLATNSRVATSATMSHSLGQSIGLDIVDPMMHLHTPFDHSTASQQAVVSSSHGDQSHNLFGSQLEIPNIEKEHTPPQCSTSFVTLSSLEPDTLLGTQLVDTSSAISTGLRAPARTSVVGPQVAPLRGSDGNPTSAIIMPTLNVGHTVASTVVSTGALRDPGVTHPLPPLLFRRPLSADELKAQLFATLMSASASGAQVDANLLKLLRPKDPTSFVTHAEFDEFKHEVRGNFDYVFDSFSSLESRLMARFTAQETFLSGLESRLLARVTTFEHSCKSQAGSSKRHRDEHDDDDHQCHEREKKLCLQVTGATTHSAQPVQNDTDMPQFTDAPPSHEAQPTDSVLTDTTLVPTLLQRLQSPQKK